MNCNHWCSGLSVDGLGRRRRGSRVVGVPRGEVVISDSWSPITRGIVARCRNSSGERVLSREDAVGEARLVALVDGAAAAVAGFRSACRLSALSSSVDSPSIGIAGSALANSGLFCISSLRIVQHNNFISAKTLIPFEPRLWSIGKIPAFSKSRTLGSLLHHGS